MSHKLTYLTHKIETEHRPWFINQYAEQLADMSDPDAHEILINSWRNSHRNRFNKTAHLSAFATIGTSETLDLLCDHFDKNPLEMLPLNQLKQIDHERLIYRVQQQFETVFEQNRLPLPWNPPIKRLVSLTTWLHRETSVNAAPYYQRTLDRIIEEHGISYHLLYNIEFMQLYNTLKTHPNEDTRDIFDYYHNAIFAEIDELISQDNLFIVRNTVLVSDTILQYRPATDYIFKLYRTQLSVVQIYWIKTIFEEMEEHLQTESERLYLVENLICFFHEAVNDKVQAALLKLLSKFDDERIISLALTYRDNAEVTATYLSVLTLYRMTDPELFDFALTMLKKRLQAIRSADRIERYRLLKNDISDLAAYLGLYTAPHQTERTWELIETWDVMGAEKLFAGFSQVIDDNPFIFDVMVYGTSHRSSYIPSIAMRQLSNCGIEAMSILLDLARNGHEDQRREALYTLGQPKFAKAVPFLIDILLSAPPHDVSDILQSLAKIDTEDAYAAINAWMESQPS